MNKNIYVGGGVVDQWGTFKRNKSEIIEEFTHNGNNYILTKNFKEHYNKALMYQNINNTKNYILVSYNTIVSEINGNKFIIYGYYSPTTARHIDSFLNYFGIKRMWKKEIEQNANKWLKVVDYIAYNL